MKVFVDANVVLDLLTQRQPHAHEALALFDIFEAGRAEGFVSVLTFVHVAYLVKKTSNKSRVLPALLELKDFVRALPVDAATIDLALKRAGADFEDDVQAICAERSKMDCIVTRNDKDFKNSGLKVYTPKEFLKQF